MSKKPDPQFVAMYGDTGLFILPKNGMSIRNQDEAITYVIEPDKETGGLKITIAKDGDMSVAISVRPKANNQLVVF